jgi:hypothetical protein
VQGSKGSTGGGEATQDDGEARGGAETRLRKNHVEAESEERRTGGGPGADAR